jgi:hypothetical protein
MPLRPEIDLAAGARTASGTVVLAALHRRSTTLITRGLLEFHVYTKPRCSRAETSESRDSGGWPDCWSR